MVFLIFGSGENQNWEARPEKKKTQRDEDFLISEPSSSSSESLEPKKSEKSL